MTKTEREIELEKEVIQEWADKNDNIFKKAFDEAISSGLEREKIHLKRALEAEKKLDIAINAMTIARDTAYQSTQDCMICQFIDDFLTKKLTEIN